MALTVSNPASREQKEEKKRQWKDPNESLKFVCERGKVMCSFCSVPIGGLKVTSNTHLLQNSRWLTTGDRNGKINFDFMGTCTHPTQKSPPCKAVINLGKWKNYSDVRINNPNAILVKSTIPCMISGMDIRVAHSGQMALLTRTDPLLLKRLIIAPESNQIFEVHVCHKLEYNARYYENGEEKKSDDIRWKVKVGEAEEVKLDEVKEIIREDCQLTGARIYFPVPQEWRYRKIFLTAYLKSDEDVNIMGMEILVKDHIVAAFYRVKSTKPTACPIERVNEAGGTVNLIAEAPVHHHQGLYRDGNWMYLSGSTGWVSSYIYMMRVNEYNKFEHISTLKLDKKLKKYKHPGGLQAANGILAVGIEKYNPIFLNSATKKDSVICFFDMNDKYTELNDLRKDVSDFASAVGIVFRKNKWIVASRGDKEAVQFYSFNNNNNKRRCLEIGEGIKNVGEFQNLNLFLDEEENVYMFGMGKGGMSYEKTGNKDTCKIYKLKIDETGETINAISIDAVWIGTDGYLKNKNYEGIDDNKLVFSCQDDTSFHWASCVHLQKNEETGIEEDRKEDPNFTGNIDTGFLGKFTIYTVEGQVSCDRMDVTDNEENKNECQEYYEMLAESEGQGETVDWTEESKNMAEILHQKKYIYVNPKIRCNSFTED